MTPPGSTGSEAGRPGAAAPLALDGLGAPGSEDGAATAPATNDDAYSSVAPPRAPPPAPQLRSASPTGQRPPGSVGAGAAVVVGGVAAVRSSVDEGPAQDVRTAAAAIKLRATLF